LPHQALADSLTWATTEESVQKKAGAPQRCSNKGGSCVSAPFEENCKDGKLFQHGKNCHCCLPDLKWSFIREACIKGHNYKTFKVKNVAACKEHCNGELGVKCQSIEFHPISGFCQISKVRSDSEDYRKPCFPGGWKYAETKDDTAPSCEGKISNKCSTKGGSCVLAPFEENCKDGKLYKRWCSGKDCQCCVPVEAPRCEGKITYKCSSKGGSCVLAPFEENCKNGKLVKEGACKGKDCQCCVPV